MLKQRILTAIVLLAILLPALFYPSHVPFACVMLVLIGAAAWEWGRLNGYGQQLSVFLGLETVALCALSWWLGLLERPLMLMWLLASAVGIVYVEGPIMLGGIIVPHARGLAGHSDADVILHAITDAILGAAGLGDMVVAPTSSRMTHGHQHPTRGRGRRQRPRLPGRHHA